jgi:hypothetical protein
MSARLAFEKTRRRVRKLAHCLVFGGQSRGLAVHVRLMKIMLKSLSIQGARITGQADEAGGG